MGRLSRHRKIKTCDPFAPNRGRILAKAERAKNAKKDEAPTEKQDKAIPRSVREMQALQKREQKIKARKLESKKNNAPKPKANTISVQTSTQTIQLEGMRPDESLKQFNNRLYSQTKQVLLGEVKKGSRQNEKMKERLKARDDKQKEKKRKRQEEEEVFDFKSLKDDVKFGEQADRPPIFTAQPKIKKPKLTEPGDRAIELMRERVRAQIESKQPMTAARSNKIANSKLSSIIDAWRGK